MWELAKLSMPPNPKKGWPLRYAQAWYSDKAAYEYKRKSPVEVERLFTTLGMTGEFWGVTGKESFR